MNFATILALCGGLTLAEEVELIWQAGGNKTSQTGLENYIPVTRKAGQSWRILIKGKFIQRDADRFRLRIRASDETILNQFAIAEQEPKDERNVVNGTWTPIKFNGGSSSLPLLGMKRAVSDVVEFSLRKGKDYSITFFARVDAQCVYQPPPGIINSYVIRGDYRGEAQWAKMIAKGMGKGFRGIGYDLDLCRDAAVPGWQATAQVSIPKSRRLEPMTIPDGKVRFDLKRLRKERRDAVDAKTRAHLKERVQSEFNHFNYHADPRLFDPGAKVPENRTYSIKAELKSHRSYSRYVGTLLDTEDPAKIERAGKILTAMSTLPEWVEKSPLASHYSLLPILRTYPTRRHLLKKEARENYEAMLRKLFTQNPQGNYKASVDDSSVTLNSGSRIYRDAATCSILGQMLEMPETLEYGLGAVARIRRIADAYPISQYNNQMYGQFFIESMAMMIQHVDHWPSVVSAMLLEERAFMTQALMFHHPTRSHTGPETGRPATALLRYFSKAYPPALETYGIEALDTVDFGTLPDYLAALTENNVNPMTARFTATANTLRQVDVVVHKTSEYSMASQSEPDSLAAPQRYNHTSECQPELHYRRADNSVGRIVLRASEQTEVEWISDYGQFFGLQHGSKLIGFYSSYYPHWTIQGKKTVPREPARIIGTSFFVPESMELFIGSEKALINVALDQPSEFQSGDMVFGREAGTYFALRILETGRMAEDTVEARLMPAGRIYPKRKVRTPDWWTAPGQASTEIVILSYESEPVEFSHHLLRKNNRYAFIVEMGDKDEFVDFDSFVRHFRSCRVKDSGHHGLKPRSVEYRSGKDVMLARYDPETNRFTERSINGKQPGETHIDSPLARWSDSGEATVGKAKLTIKPPLPITLFNTGKGTTAVWKMSSVPATLRLETPDGWIEAKDFPIGKLVYRPAGNRALEIYSSDAAEVLFKAKSKTGAIYEWNARPVKPVGKPDGERVLRPD